jgi:hypothetical protein
MESTFRRQLTLLKMDTMPLEIDNCVINLEAGPDDDKLCSRCAKINLHKLFHGDRLDHQDWRQGDSCVQIRYVLDFEREKSCRLCSILVAAHTHEHPSCNGLGEMCTLIPIIATHTPAFLQPEHQAGHFVIKRDLLTVLLNYEVYGAESDDKIATS